MVSNLMIRLLIIAASELSSLLWVGFAHGERQEESGTRAAHARRAKAELEALRAEGRTWNFWGRFSGYSGAAQKGSISSSESFFM
jgi:hypothetical protein